MTSAAEYDKSRSRREGAQDSTDFDLVPGTFVYTPPSGTILGAGTHQLSATFTPTDSVNYLSVNVQATLTVAKATPRITWAQPAPIITGTPLSTKQLDATANVPGTFKYTPAAGTVLRAGTFDLEVTFTPMDASNYQADTSEVDLTVKSR
jgi:hypothetical protein